MNDIGSYLISIFDKYQVVAGIVVPAFMIAWGMSILRYVEKFFIVNTGLMIDINKIITTARLFIALIAVFIIGFLAWRDERMKYLDIEENYNNLRTKSEILTSIARFDIDIAGRNDGGALELRIRNVGKISAYIHAFRPDVQYVEKNFDQKNGIEVTRIMGTKLLKSNISEVPEWQVPPEHSRTHPIVPIYFDDKASSSDRHFNQFMQGKIAIFVALIIVYRDDLLARNEKFRVAKFCAYYMNGILSSYVTCPTQNEITIINRDK